MADKDVFDFRYALQQDRKRGGHHDADGIDLTAVPDEVEELFEDAYEEEPDEQAVDDVDDARPARDRPLPDVDVPDEDEDMTVSAEMTPMGTSMSMTSAGGDEQGPDFASVPARRGKGNKPAAKQKPTRLYSAQQVPKEDPGVKMAYLRNIPQSFVSKIRAKPGLEGAGNNTDAVAAYLAVELDERGCLTAEQARLADQYAARKVEANPIESLKKSVNILVAHAQNSEKLAKESELALAFLIFDRLGFRRDNPSRSGDVDLLEHGMEDLIRRLRDQTKQHDGLEQRRDGRPIR